MLIQLVKNELSKFLRIKYFILLALITMVIPFLFSMNNAGDSKKEQGASYQSEMEKYLLSCKADAQNDDGSGFISQMSPYSKELFDQYHMVIQHRVDEMKKTKETENNTMIAKTRAYESTNEVLRNVLFILTICIVAIIFAGEFSSGTYYQTFIYPCRRGKIYIAKLITSGLLLFSLVLYVFLAMQIFGVVIFGGASRSYLYVQSGVLKEMPFWGYCGITALFQYLTLLAVMMISMCVAIVVKSKLTTLLVVIVGTVISMGGGKFLALLMNPAYNFLPTTTFDFTSIFLKMPMIDEIAAFNSSAKVFDITYSLIFMILYDVVVLALLFLFGKDVFDKNDIG